jgi:putative hydrolase of the HAD superfamily
MYDDSGDFMTVRSLLFDLDETLMVEQASVHSALEKACSLVAGRGVETSELKQAVLSKAKELWRAAPTHSYCRTVGISSWEGLHGDFAGADPNLEALRNWVPTFRVKTWTSALAEFGVRDADLAARLDETWRRERRERHVKFPDTDSTLARLRPRFRFGLVTNGAPRIQREKIERAGLAPLFDVVVVSGDIGVGKPDAGIFRRALELLRIEAHETLMIGNSLDRDIAGARAAGIPSIWVDREGKEPIPPDCRRVTSLGGILPLLEA